MGSAGGGHESGQDLALRSAAKAGLPLPEDAFTATLRWLDDVTDDFDGTVTERGGEPPGLCASPDPMHDVRATAAGMVVRLACDTSRDDPLLHRAAAELLAHPPEWSDRSGSFDPEYWCFATRVMFALGGDPWRRWNNALKGPALDHQARDRALCSFGSWDPQPGPSSLAGRIGTTALCLMAVEVYYRYARVFGSAKPVGERVSAPGVQSSIGGAGSVRQGRSRQGGGRTDPFAVRAVVFGVGVAVAVDVWERLGPPIHVWTPGALTHPPTGP